MTLTVTGMRSTALLSVWLLGSCFTRDAAVHGFAPYPQHPTTTTTTSTMLYAASFQSPDDFDNKNKVVASSNIVGNFGFDPMHLAETNEQLVHYRQAEIKHARLAMLAVLAFAWSDLNVIDTLGATPFFEGRTFPEFLGVMVGLPAALELYGEKVEQDHADIDIDNNSNSNGNDNSSYFIGNLELDPFHLYPAETQGQRQLQFAEIMTGRACMLVAALRLTQMLLSSLGVDEQSLVSFLPFVQTTVGSVTDIAV